MPKGKCAGTQTHILRNPGVTHSDSLHSKHSKHGEYRNALRLGYRGWQTRTYLNMFTQNENSLDRIVFFFHIFSKCFTNVRDDNSEDNINKVINIHVVEKWYTKMKKKKNNAQNLTYAITTFTKLMGEYNAIPCAYTSRWHLLTGLGRSLLKTLWEKGEIACKSNFSFSCNVFNSVKDRNYNFCYI